MAFRGAHRGDAEQQVGQQVGPSPVGGRGALLIDLRQPLPGHVAEPGPGPQLLGLDEALGRDGEVQVGLLLAGANQQRHLGRGPRGQPGQRVARQHRAVDHGEERLTFEFRVVGVTHQAGRRLPYGVDREFVQLGNLPIVDPEAVEHADHHGPGAPAALHPVGGAALHHGPVEQAGGGGHSQQGPDARRPRRLPDHGHPVRVATESLDVVLHPPQGRDLVQQGHVDGAFESRTADRRQVEEPPRSEPVVHRHHDRIAVAG